MKIAVEEADIRAIHPERMEALARFYGNKTERQMPQMLKRMEDLQSLMSNFQ